MIDKNTFRTEKRLGTPKLMSVCIHAFQPDHYWLREGSSQ